MDPGLSRERERKKSEDEEEGRRGARPCTTNQLQPVAPRDQPDGRAGGGRVNGTEDDGRDPSGRGWR